MRRLNSKLKVRGIEIKDLVTDLSDGVREFFSDSSPLKGSALRRILGRSHPPP